MTLKDGKGKGEFNEFSTSLSKQKTFSIPISQFPAFAIEFL